MKMQDKTAIVTGGGRDIGRACAMRLAAEGASVAVGYSASAAGAEAVVAEIKNAGGKAIAVQADLSKREGADALVAKTQAEFGEKIDSIIHVAGGLIARRTLQEIDDAFWDTVMDVNLRSLLYICQAAVPSMPKGSTIVTFASQAGRDGGGGGAIAYATSKGAVMTMTRGLAKELGPDIRVNSLCPGMIDTTFHDTFTVDDVRTKVAGSTLLKREGTSEECANLSLFLASDESSYMTGTCIDINGGLLFS